MTHTPTPWGAGQFPSHIHGPDGIGICKFESKHGFYRNWEDNAEFIVTAVNSHDALLEALESIDRLFRARRAAGGEEAEKVVWYFKDTCPLRVKIDAAIKAAKS